MLSKVTFLVKMDKFGYILHIIRYIATGFLVKIKHSYILLWLKVEAAIFS